MEINMMDYGKIIIEKGMENSSGQMATSIKENGRKIKKMDLGLI